MTQAAQIVVRDIEAAIRPVRLRLPFRFGAVTLTACPQLFVRARVALGGRSAEGWAAEMMVPKWFDKRPERSAEQNVADLAASFERAAAAYRSDAPAAPFVLHARHYAALQDDAGGATALSKAYGQAVLDRAVLDATCRLLDLSFFDAMTRNAAGLGDSAIAPDMAGFAWSKWLGGLAPRRCVDARHTVGLLDDLHSSRLGDDGLPVSLPAVIDRYGVRFFKIKLGGDPAADAARLAEVLGVLDRAAPDHRYTLDGNEQYADAAAVTALFERLAALPAYASRPEALLYVEQPFGRDRSLDAAATLPPLPAPLLLDEGDGSLDAFPQAATLGWRGVSAKSCKGLYKAIINRARCTRWNDALRREGRPPAYFMSAEDLTCQAGLSVQQDLALAALLGLGHSERNGHHYGDGFGSAPDAEQHAFASAHPDLYEAGEGRPRLRIAAGRIALDSLFQPGFAHAADPDWRSLQPLAAATSAL